MSVFGARANPPPLGSLSYVRTMAAGADGWRITITLTDKAEVDAWRAFFRAAIEGRNGGEPCE